MSRFFGIQTKTWMASAMPTSCWRCKSLPAPTQPARVGDPSGVRLTIKVDISRQARRRAATHLKSAKEPHDNNEQGMETVNGTAHTDFNPDDVEIEYIDAEPEEPDDSEMMPYFNDQPIDGVEREVMSLDEVAELTREGKEMGLDKVQAAGPEAVFVAGFRLAELPLLHTVLGTEGESGQGTIRMIPVADEILGMTVSRALDSLPVTWDAVMGRVGPCTAWGAERVLLFSGFSLKAQAAMLELVEELGLGRITPGQIDEADMEKHVGDVLADVVQEYRKAVQRAKDGKAPVWEQAEQQQETKSDGKNGMDWTSELPKGYDLTSDDPSNLGNAIRPDGSINQDYVSSLMDNVKGQMLQALEEKGLDSSTLSDLKIDIGSGAASSMSSEIPCSKEESNASAPEFVDLTSLQGQLMASNAETSRIDEPENLQNSEPGTFVDTSGMEPSDSDDQRQQASDELLAAFETALASGISREDLEELIGDAYNGEGETLAAEEISSPTDAPVVDNGDSDLYEKPTDGNYINISEFKEFLIQENSKEEQTEEGIAGEHSTEEDSSTMTRSELRETAARHNLNFEDLLRDAESRGIQIRDG